MILPAARDPRLVTIRRGKTLTDPNHQLLAVWAAACAEHVLALFEESNLGDDRPWAVIDAARAWARGNAAVMVTRAVGGHAMGAARPLRGAAQFVACAAGQAACVAHVPEHDLGAAPYAIKAVATAALPARAQEAGKAERDWRRQQIPRPLYALVLEDQGRRNSIFRSVFDD